MSKKKSRTSIRASVIVGCLVLVGSACAAGCAHAPASVPAPALEIADPMEPSRLLLDGCKSVDGDPLTISCPTDIFKKAGMGCLDLAEAYEVQASNLARCTAISEVDADAAAWDVAELRRKLSDPWRSPWVWGAVMLVVGVATGVGVAAGVAAGR